MNKHYNQLGKIFLEKTNPQNPAARRDIAAAKERAKKSGQSFKRGSLRRGLAADDARVRRGEKPRHTTGPEGQQAMADDPRQRDPHEPPHPSRRRKDDWTVYKRIGSILSEWESVPQTDHFSKENVAAAKRRRADTAKAVARADKARGGPRKFLSVQGEEPTPTTTPTKRTKRTK